MENYITKKPQSIKQKWAMLFTQTELCAVEERKGETAAAANQTAVVGGLLELPDSSNTISSPS